MFVFAYFPIGRRLKNESSGMELQEAEEKFRKLQKFIPFLESFLDTYSQTKNESSSKSQKLDKAKTLLDLLKAGFKR